MTAGQLIDAIVIENIRAAHMRALVATAADAEVRAMAADIERRAQDKLHTLHGALQRSLTAYAQGRGKVARAGKCYNDSRLRQCAEHMTWMA